MGKYISFQRKIPPRPWDIHPLWRGIGCLLIIIIPVISFLGAHEIVNGNLHIFNIPKEITGNIHFPTYVWKIPILAALAGPISNYPNPLAVFLTGLILLLILTTLLSLVYAVAYKYLGPPPYTPIDSPPIKVKARRRKKKSR